MKEPLIYKKKIREVIIVSSEKFCLLPWKLAARGPVVIAN
jgi:hypothetical protein